MSELRLALLGPPRIEVGGAPLRVDTRKAVALLAWLACAGPRRSREEAAALLWPDADAAHARAALRRTLSTLNHALGGGPRLGPRVAADRAWLELVAPGMALDVERFDRLAAGCGAHAPAADGQPEEPCTACVAVLTEAVALHRGDFLAGFSLRDAAAFEDWQLAEAARLRRALGGALQRLSGVGAALGRFEQAIGAAERWLALDPLHEPAHRQLMRLYCWSGQRAAAIRQYRACVRVLDEELGVPPLAETTALYQAVVEDRVEPPPEPPAEPASAVASAPARSQAAEPGAPAGTATAPGSAVPLVGRAAAWQVLLETWEGVARAGRGWLLALTGEAGIGKTRLAQEFAAHVGSAGGQVVACRCYEGERVAYGPLADGLRAALALAAPRPGGDARAWAGTLEPHWLAEAARLLPELAALVPRGAVAVPAADGPGAQRRFLEGLGRTLLAAADGPRPGLLLLDDLHWADEATLDAVGYLVRRLDRWPLLVLACWRDEDVPRGHRLRGLLAEAQRAGTAATLPLRRLDRPAVRELLQAAGHAEAEVDAEAEALHARSEGLPLLLVAYLAAWPWQHPGQGQPSGEPAAAPASAGALPALPGGARELFQARLERVSEAAWQVLTAAAVIGRSFDADTLREASGRGEDEVVAALEELGRLGLIHELPAPAAAGSPAYDFGHEQLRMLVYQQAGLARRRLLHRRVAETLAGRGHGHGHGAQAQAQAQAASIARHFQLAGRDAEAAWWFAVAGGRAAALYANREAVALYQSALALGHPEVARLQLALGDLHTLLGAYGDALVAYEAAAARCEPGLLATVEHRLGGLHQRRGDWDAADAHLEAALAALDAAGGDGAVAERARLVADRSLVAHRRGQAQEAAALAAEALALAERAADRAALAQSHNLLGMLATSVGDHEGARRHLERSLALAEDLPDPGARVAARNNLALAHRAAGRLQEALDLTAAALELCAAQGDRHRQAALHNNLADLFHAAGRADEAMAHLKQAVALFAEVGEPDQLQPAIWQLVEW